MKGRAPDGEARRAQPQQAGRRGKRRGHGARHATGARGQSRVFESAGLPRDLRAVAEWVFGRN